MDPLLSLKKGDTVGVMAPSYALGKYHKAMLRQAADFLNRQGFRLYIHPQTYYSDGKGHAGTPQQRADALHDLYADPAIKAILTAYGGEGAMDMLDRLDYDLIARNPKIISGYSDVTVLLNAIHARTGQVTFHGPYAVSLVQKFPEKHLSQFFNLAAGQSGDIPLERARILKPGTATGTLIGGNLTRFGEMMDMPRWRPDLKGAILFLEDWDERPSYYARILDKIHRKGDLTKAAGLVFGSFIETIGRGSAHDRRQAAADAIRKATAGLDMPIVYDAPFGHGRKLYTLPIGARAVLKAEVGQPVLRIDL